MIASTSLYSIYSHKPVYIFLFFNYNNILPIFTKDFNLAFPKIIHWFSYNHFCVCYYNRSFNHWPYFLHRPLCFTLKVCDFCDSKMSGGGFRDSIPNSVKKIQNIKEITSNQIDEDIYSIRKIILDNRETLKFLKSKWGICYFFFIMKGSCF